MRVFSMVALALVACGSSTPKGVVIDLDAPDPASSGKASPGAAAAPATGEHPEPYDIFPGVTVTGDWVHCRSEDECVVVEVGCCDHCNGGGITAVNKAFAKAARSLIEKKLASQGPCKACGKAKCDAPSAHQLVCMTRACHIADLEEEVESRMWGGSSSPPSGDAVIMQGDIEKVIESR